MEDLSIIIAAITSLVLTLALAPYFMKKLNEEGLVSKDYYKRDDVYLPSKGGLLIIFAALLALVFTSIIMRTINLLFIDSLPRAFTPYDEAVLFVMMFFAFYGTLDDYMNVGRPLKIAIPLLFAYPLVMAYISPPHIDLPFLGQLSMSEPIRMAGVELFNLSRLYRYLVIPFFIMIVANLVNMHSGFNGMQSGLSTMILFTIIIKAAAFEDTNDLYTASAIFGAMLGFWWYNKYPSRMFEGNVGAMAIGGALGAIIIVMGFVLSATIMMIPHIINFLMYAYWRMKRVQLVKQGRDVGHYHHQIKFGEVDEKGILTVPNRLTLKWLFPYHFKMTEKETIVVMYGLSAIFCAIGFFWPYY